LNLAENARLLLRRPAVFLSRRSYILVLSHMRSYSSLLCHILGSHPEIAGYAEMHQSYNGRLDLVRLRARVFRSLDGELAGRLVLDKILHNDYSVSESLINHSPVYPIFLVRNPVDSLTGIIKMGERIPNVEWYSDPYLVTTYYETRLQCLAQLAEKIDARCLFIKAEEMIDASGAALQSISNFLELEQPLKESYSIFKHTGEPGWGDDSSAILQGRIVRNPPKDALDIEERFVSRARRAYEECCRVLASCGRGRSV
jgi:hypothetical protein